MNHDALKALVRKKIAEFAKKRGVNAAIGDKTDLFDAGAIDSLDFLQLLMAVEEKFKVELDFSDKEQGDYGTIDGFVACVAQKTAA